jgi:hypothetical protein
MFSGNRDKRKDRRLSNHNTLSPMEDLKEGGRTQKGG